jgi:hypothetical protein
MDLLKPSITGTPSFNYSHSFSVAQEAVDQKVNLRIMPGYIIRRLLPNSLFYFVPPIDYPDVRKV